MAQLNFQDETDYDKAIRIQNEIAGLEAQIKSLDTNKVPKVVEALNAEMLQLKQQFKETVEVAAKANEAIGGEFNSKIQESSGGINDMTQQLTALNETIGDLEPGLRNLADSYRAVSANSSENFGTSVTETTKTFAENIKLIAQMRQELGLAATAQKTFNLATKSNIYLAIGAAIIEIVSALSKFTKKTDEFAAIKKDMDGINAAAATDYESQANKINNLSRIIEDNNASLESRNQALNQMKSIVPSYNGLLDQEGRLINNNTEAIKNYLKQLNNKIKIEANEDQLNALYRKRNELEPVAIEQDQKYQAVRQDNALASKPIINIKPITRLLGLDKETNLKKDLDKTLEQISAIDAQINSLNSDLIELYSEKIPDNVIPQIPAKAGSTKEKRASKENRASGESKSGPLDERKVRDHARKMQDLQNKLKQAEIDSLDEGQARTLKQMNLNHEMEILQLNREKEDYLQTKIDIAREKYENDPKNAGVEFDESTVKLTNTEISQFDESKVALRKKQEKEFASFLNSQIKDFQNFADRRLEIETNFNADVEALNKKRTAENSSQIDKTIEQWTKNKSKSLEIIDREEVSELLKNSGLLTGLFTKTSDLSRKSLKEITESTKQLLDYINNEPGAELPLGISEEQVEVLRNNSGEVKNIYDNLTEKQKEIDEDIKYPFSGFVNGFKSLRESANLAKEAAEVTTGGEGLLKKSAEAKAKGLNYIKQGTVEAANGVSYLAKKMSELAEITGDESLKESSEMFSAIAQNFNAAAQGFASGSWIGAIIGGITDMINQTFTAFATVRAEEKETENNRLSFLNKYNRSLLKIKNENYDSAFGSQGFEKAIDAAGKAKKALKMYEDEVSKKTAPEVKKEFNSLGATIFGFGVLGNASFAGLGKSISNETKTLQTSFDKGYTDLQSMAIKTTDRSGWANFWGKKDSYTSLKDLAPELWDDQGMFNTEAAKDFLETNTQISDEQRKQIQGAIDLKDAYDENTKIIRDQIKEIFGSLGEAATNSIVEAITTGADAFEIFKDAGSKVIGDLGKKLMYELFFAKKFKDLQTELEASYDGKTSEEVAQVQTVILGEFFKEMKQTMSDATQWGAGWGEFANQNGFDNIWGDSGLKQQSTQKGFASMSQDSADELNGRFTALQLSGEELKIQSIIQNQYLNVLSVNSSAILTVNSETRNISDEIRTIQVNSFLELQNIKDNTGAIVRPIREIAADIAIVKQNTSKL